MNENLTNTEQKPNTNCDLDNDSIKSNKKTNNSSNASIESLDRFNNEIAQSLSKRPKFDNRENYNNSNDSTLNKNTDSFSILNCENNTKNGTFHRKDNSEDSIILD